MTDPKNPADGAAQPSVDDRTVPSPNPPGSDTPPPQPLPEGLGSALGPGPVSKPRPSVVANKRLEAPIPIIRTFSTWPTGVATFSPAAVCREPTVKTGRYLSARRPPSI